MTQLLAWLRSTTACASPPPRHLGCTQAGQGGPGLGASPVCPGRAGRARARTLRASRGRPTCPSAQLTAAQHTRHSMPHTQGVAKQSEGSRCCRVAYREWDAARGSTMHGCPPARAPRCLWISTTSLLSSAMCVGAPLGGRCDPCPCPLMPRKCASARPSYPCPPGPSTARPLYNNSTAHHSAQHACTAHGPHPPTSLKKSPSSLSRPDMRPLHHASSMCMLSAAAVAAEAVKY